jgi:protocatechuate 3,4-dioxygenase beta subunit
MRSVIVLCAAGVIAALSAGSVDAASQARCTPTAGFGGGPDRGATTPLRAKIGTGHVLTGVVMSPFCKRLAGARVTFWQSNAKGIYTAAGRGAVMTDKSGRFRFEGPMPKAYDGRPGHIHIKVEAPGFDPLYTEYEPMGTARGNVRLVLSPSPL